VYAVFGLSAVLNTGTFALYVRAYTTDSCRTSLLLGQAIRAHIAAFETDDEHLHPYPQSDAHQALHVELALSITFLVGCVQVGASVLRVGRYASRLISDELVGGFTCAAAFHIATSQLPHFLGVKVPGYRGAFGLVRTWAWTVTAGVEAAHGPTVVMALAAWAAMEALKGMERRRKAVFEQQRAALGRDILRMPTMHGSYVAVQKESSARYIPIPDVLVTIVAAVAVVALLGLDTSHQIAVLGAIPHGLPRLSAPDARIWQPTHLASLLPSAVLIAVIAYVVSISIAKTFAPDAKGEGLPAPSDLASRHSVRTMRIDDDQELLALGLSSMVGAYTSAYVSCGSLTRSAVLAAAGAHTPLSSALSSAVVAATLLWLTPLFYYLPRCVLAAVILAVCRGLVLKGREAWRLYRAGETTRCAVWTLTFMCVLIFGVEIGIFCGVACVLALRLAVWRRGRIKFL
jgi:MFS superfamily sulfate permease-like transporter